MEHLIVVLAYCLVVAASVQNSLGEELQRSSRISRSPGILDKFKSLTSFFHETKKEVAPENLAPLYPIWKIHKYNGLHLKPVPLSSLPYAKVSIATPATPAIPAPTKMSQILPTLEQAKLILGTSSDEETINALKELASTRSGLEMIAGFIKANIANANIDSENVSEEVNAAINQYSAQAEEKAMPQSQDVIPTIHPLPQEADEKLVSVSQKFFQPIQLGVDYIKANLPFKAYRPSNANGPPKMYGPPKVYGSPHSPLVETYSVPKTPVVETHSAPKEPLLKPSSDSSSALDDGSKSPEVRIPHKKYEVPIIPDAGNHVTESAVIPSRKYGIPTIPYYEIKKNEEIHPNVAAPQPTTQKFIPNLQEHPNIQIPAQRLTVPSPVYSVASRSQINSQDLPLLEIPSASAEKIKVPVFHETTSSKKFNFPSNEYGVPTYPERVVFKPIVVNSGDSQDSVIKPSTDFKDSVDVSKEKYGLPANGDHVGDSFSNPMMPKIIYGEPKDEEIKPNVERTMDQFIPFPILPELPSLPNAENLPEFQSLTHFGKPVFSFSSGPISFTSNTKLFNPVHQRQVFETKFEQPGFSYTQLSKIPLEEGVHLERTPGQISSYGEPVSAYVFDEDKAPESSERKSVAVKSSIKVEDKKEITNNKIDVSIYNNPARRRWVPKNKRN